MIKAIILDVDGVLVGGKNGFNWPTPHISVIKALKNLRSQGVVVSLCTGKGTFAIKEIVKKAYLDNFHIGDGGAVVTDFINNKIIEKHIISKVLASKVIDAYLNIGAYLELYTTEGYFIEKNQLSEITKKHAAILYRQPEMVKSLKEAVERLGIVKIMPIAKTAKEHNFFTKTFQPFAQNLYLQWGRHPSASPYYFGIITPLHISKKHAAKTISEYYKIPLDNFLGVGDQIMDWEFIGLCKYKAAMGNASQELKNLVKKNRNGFLGPSVDDNGILEIFSHFGLKYN